MQVCPYPDCGYRGEFISKAHCRINHNMEQSEVFAKYGKPKQKNPFNKLDAAFDKISKAKEMGMLRSGRS